MCYCKDLTPKGQCCADAEIVEFTRIRYETRIEMDRPDPTQRRIASQVKLARLRDSKQMSAVVFNQSMKIKINTKSLAPTTALTVPSAASAAAPIRKSSWPSSAPKATAPRSRAKVVELNAKVPVQPERVVAQCASVRRAQRLACQPRIAGARLALVRSMAKSSWHRESLLSDWPFDGPADG